MPRKLKPNTLVKFDPPKGYEDAYPFKKDDRLLYLGEITNMPGHCIVVNDKGKVFYGYHPENFIKLTDDEV